MKKILLTIMAFVAVSGFSAPKAAYFFAKAKPMTVPVQEETISIEWLDFETAVDRNEVDKKHFFIDIYTNWCGWCKKMDASTFTDPDVVAYLTENFHAVKMDAESKEGIVYNETLYEYKIYSGNKGYNELAVNLLSGKMSFPSFVILSKREAKLGVINGYQKPDQLISALKKYVKK